MHPFKTQNVTACSAALATSEKYRMKKAIIVGATSGIGNELAKILVKNGYLVGITSE